MKPHETTGTCSPRASRLSTGSGKECPTVSHVVASPTRQDAPVPEFGYSTLYNMVSTCNRQLAILGRIRDRRRRTGEAAGRTIDFDIRNLERIQRLLVAMERSSHTGHTHPQDGLAEPLLPGIGPRKTSPRGTRARAPTPWLPGFDG